MVLPVTMVPAVVYLSFEMFNLVCCGVYLALMRIIAAA